MNLSLYDAEAIQEFAARHVTTLTPITIDTRVVKTPVVIVTKQPATSATSDAPYFLVEFETPLQDDVKDVRVVLNYSGAPGLVRFRYPLAPTALLARVTAEEGLIVRASGVISFPLKSEALAETATLLVNDLDNDAIGQTDALAAYLISCGSLVYFTYVGGTGRAPKIDLPPLFDRTRGSTNSVTTFQRIDALEAARVHEQIIVTTTLSLLALRQRTPDIATVDMESAALTLLRNKYLVVRENAVQYGRMLMSDMYSDIARQENIVFDLAKLDDLETYLGLLAKRLSFVVLQTAELGYAKGASVLQATAESVCVLFEKTVAQQFVTLLVGPRAIQRDNVAEFVICAFYLLAQTMNDFNLEAQSVLRLASVLQTLENDNGIDIMLVSLQTLIDQTNKRVTETELGVSEIKASADRLAGAVQDNTAAIIEVQNAIQSVRADVDATVTATSGNASAIGALDNRVATVEAHVTNETKAQAAQAGGAFIGGLFAAVAAYLALRYAVKSISASRDDKVVAVSQQRRQLRL